MGTSGRQAGRQAGHSVARLFAAAVPSRRQSQLTIVFETFSLGYAVQDKSPGSGHKHRSSGSPEKPEPAGQAAAAAAAKAPQAAVPVATGAGEERKQRAPAAEDCKKGQAPRLFDRAVAAAVGKRSGSEEPLRGSKRSRS